MAITHILWTADAGDAFELCHLDVHERGATLSGTALRAHGEGPYEVRYKVQIDPSWVTRQADVHISGLRSERSTLFTFDDEGWRRDGSPLKGFDDCLDIDLELSPSTNTLPIRRLGLRSGARADVAALWISTPQLEPERVEQTYERVARDRYVYRSGSFEAGLLVDEDGLCLEYENFFRTVTVLRS